MNSGGKILGFPRICPNPLFPPPENDLKNTPLQAACRGADFRVKDRGQKTKDKGCRPVLNPLSVVLRLPSSKPHLSAGTAADEIQEDRAVPAVRGRRRAGADRNRRAVARRHLRRCATLRQAEQFVNRDANG